WTAVDALGTAPLRGSGEWSSSCMTGNSRLVVPMGKCQGGIGNEPLVSRALPFPCTPGERRNVWSIDQKIGQLQGSANIGLGTPAQCFERVAGVDNRVHPTCFQPKQQSRESAWLSHGLTTQDSHPVAGLADRVEQCFYQHVDRQYCASIQCVGPRYRAKRATAQGATLDLEYAPSPRSLD